jgi:ribonuclease E
MREDVRTDEPYGWTRPRAPDGDPYIWFDPLQPRQRPAQSEDMATQGIADQAPAEAPAPTSSDEVAVAQEAVKPAKPARRRRPTKAELLAQAQADEATTVAPEAVVEAEAPAPISAEPTVEADIWVELPAVNEVKAKPARARRSRAKAQPEAEAQVEEVAQAPVEAAPVAAEPIPVPAEPVSVVVAEPAPEPAPEPTPDPAAIIAPPSQPKKGWWRR